MKTQFCFLFLLASAAAFATPSVTITSVEQDSSFNRVKVSYSLTEDAVVTWSATTNSVAVSPQKLTRVWGDINRKIAAPGGTFFWAGAEELNNFNEVVASLNITLTAWPTNDPPDYMVVDCAGKSNVTYYVSAEAVPFGVTNNLYKTTKMVMRKIPAKGVTWKMGSPADEAGRSTADGATYEVRHNVTLTEDYYIGIYPMTQRQYVSFTESNPSYWNRTRCTVWMTRPVENISFNTIRGDKSVAPWNATTPYHTVGGILLKMRNATGIKFDLPTDAQWEYACRAGTSTPFNNGTGSINGLGWHSGNWSQDPDLTANMTHIVGLLQPNKWGLYDMHGNVYTWCLDWNGALNTSTAVIDPAGPATDPSHNARIRRGGCYNHTWEWARSAAHRSYTASSPAETIGFRVVAPAAGYWTHE